jgi:hypothetical protein
MKLALVNLVKDREKGDNQILALEAVSSQTYGSSCTKSSFVTFQTSVYKLLVINAP